MEPAIEPPRAQRVPFFGRPGPVARREKRRWFVRVLRVFVSSPGDLSAERQVVDDVVNRWNESPQIAERIALRVLRWEKYVPPVLGDPPQVVVDRFLGRAASADIVVVLAGGRLGTRLSDPQTGLPRPSGTEHELDSAYQANRRKGKPILLVYRKDDAAVAVTDAEEAERVRAFWARFEGPNRHYVGIDPKRFSTAAVLEDHLSRDLSVVVHGIDSGERKRKRLWLAACVALGVALGWATHLGYQRRQTQAAVDGILEGAFQSEATGAPYPAVWEPVPGRLVALGPGAVRPIFHWLGRNEIHSAADQPRPDQSPTRALIAALQQQGAKGERDDVCEKLFQILRSGDTALRYPKDTHLAAIEGGIVPLRCPGMAEALCAYVSHVKRDSFLYPTDVVADVRDLAASHLRPEEVARCRGVQASL